MNFRSRFFAVKSWIGLISAKSSPRPSSQNHLKLSSWVWIRFGSGRTSGSDAKFWRSRGDADTRSRATAMGGPSSGLRAGQADREQGIDLWQQPYRNPEPTGRSTDGNLPLSTRGRRLSRGGQVGDRAPALRRAWRRLRALWDRRRRGGARPWRGLDPPDARPFDTLFARQRALPLQRARRALGGGDPAARGAPPSVPARLRGERRPGECGDPARPARRGLHADVRARTAADAEIYAKAALLLGTAEAPGYLEGHGALGWYLAP